MAYDDPPDTENIPDDREDYLRGLYAEVRQGRRMTENIFWIVLIFTVVMALSAGWLLFHYADLLP